MIFKANETSIVFLTHRTCGPLKRYKARLVIKGYTQQVGVDFLGTLSPVAKLTTLRVLLSMAAAKGWHLMQLLFFGPDVCYAEHILCFLFVRPHVCLKKPKENFFVEQP